MRKTMLLMAIACALSAGTLAADVSYSGSKVETGEMYSAIVNPVLDLSDFSYASIGFYPDRDSDEPLESVELEVEKSEEGHIGVSNDFWIGWRLVTKEVLGIHLLADGSMKSADGTELDWNGMAGSNLSGMDNGYESVEIYNTTTINEDGGVSASVKTAPIEKSGEYTSRLYLLVESL